MTSDHFKAQMRRLAGLKYLPMHYTGHWEAVQAKQVPEDVLTRAVTLALTSRADFPAPAELLELCDQVDPAPSASYVPPTVPLDAPVVLGTLPTGREITATAEQVYHCLACRDTGWEEVAPRTLERRQTVRRCFCRPTNPVLVAARAANARYAAGRVERGQR